MKKILVVGLLAVNLLNAGKIELSGSVFSDNQKMLTSRYMGFIKSVNVSEGDRVKNGELL
jgi:multidrug efflux pump subunit AcrA (membrane-fusion protein)